MYLCAVMHLTPIFNSSRHCYDYQWEIVLDIVSTRTGKKLHKSERMKS